METTGDPQRKPRTTIKGPIRDQVRTNIKRLREFNGWSLVQFSKRLTELGHPLVPTAIHKIEQGDRKVDVDDLVALALALGVTPNMLLLPGVRHGRRRVQLTAEKSAGFAEVWQWARGERSLGRSRDQDGSPKTIVFIEGNHPDDAREYLERVLEPARFTKLMASIEAMQKMLEERGADDGR